MNCCDHFGHNCNQGRACPLRTQDGGERIDTEADEEAWSLPALFFFGIVAVACIAAALQAVF